jgi:hypothetical protein
MPREMATLVGVIKDWRAGREGTNQPSKYVMFVEVAEASREVELNIWPADKDQKELLEYLNDIGSPEVLLNQRVRARARFEKTYQDTDQYKLLSISAMGSAPSKVEAEVPSKAGRFKPLPKPQPSASPRAPQTRTLDPNDRDMLIVDQVLYKGVIDRLNNGTDLQQAIQESIAAWDGVRARHYAPEEPSEPAPATYGFGDEGSLIVEYESDADSIIDLG